MTRNQTVEINHLTVLQIQYLTELEQLEKGRGTIGAVAAKCGVKHPTVSRFFKSCIEKGGSIWNAVGLQKESMMF